MRNTVVKNILFLPGVLNTAEVWHRLLKRLEGTISPHFASIHQHDTMKAIVEEIWQNLPDHFLNERFAIVGFSMGGYVALEMLHHPIIKEHILGLAMLNSKALPDQPAEAALRQAAIRSTERVNESQFIGVSPRLYRRLVGKQAQTNATIAKSVYSMAKTIGQTGFLTQQKANLNRQDHQLTLAQFDKPTLMLSGSADQIIRPCDSIAIRPQGSHQQVILEDIGHLSPLEAPDQVAKAMQEWMILLD